MSLFNHVHLGCGELVNVFGVSSAADIDEANLTHAQHQASVLHQVRTEGVLQNEELLFKLVLGFDTVLVLDGLLPHAHELPFVELTEETVSLDVIVGVALNQPLT